MAPAVVDAMSSEVEHATTASSRAFDRLRVETSRVRRTRSEPLPAPARQTDSSMARPSGNEVSLHLSG